MKLILASASPRRAEILRNAGFTFSVISSAVDETPFPNESARDHVARLAAAKADVRDGVETLRRIDDPPALEDEIDCHCSSRCGSFVRRPCIS